MDETNRKLAKFKEAKDEEYRKSAERSPFRPH